MAKRVMALTLSSGEDATESETLSDSMELEKPLYKLPGTRDALTGPQKMDSSLTKGFSIKASSENKGN